MREDKKYKQVLIVLIIVFTGILLLRAVPRQSRIYQSSNNIYTLPNKEISGSDVSQPTQKNKQKNKKSNMKILYYGSSADTVEFLKNYDTIEELAQDADNIVFGTVNEKNSYMDEEGDTVYTDYSVELKKVYKGKLKEKLEEKENIHIIDLGGCIKASEYFAKQDDPKIKKIKEKVIKNPNTTYVQYNFGSDWQPQIGNQCLWFLTTDYSDNQIYTPLNSWQGVYRLIDNKKGQYFQRYSTPGDTDIAAQVTLVNMEKKLSWE